MPGLILILSMAGSCIELYEPDISKYENVFVVDGEINNLPGPYEVKLSTGYSFNEDSGSRVSGAQVKIIENTGLEVSLTEMSKGLYSTAGSNFQGTVGNSYKIQIEYNNEIYESEFEKLKSPVPIDNIYWEYVKRDYAGVNGIYILLDTRDPAGNTHYYAWEYEETWKFEVPHYFNNRPEWFVCYRHTSSYNFEIGTSVRKNEDRIERHPLLFIDNNTNRLRWRYSILVKQYALSEQAYQFYKNLITLNQDQGTLFDPIPYTLVGNVKNLTDRKKPVIGYFLVSGVSERRIFIDNDDLPPEYQPTAGFKTCMSQIVEMEYPVLSQEDTIIIETLQEQGFFIYDIDTFPTPPFAYYQYFFTSSNRCINCTLTGDINVPEFWEEK